MSNQPATVVQRLTTLDAQVVTLQLQVKSLLHANLAAAENNQRLTEIIAEQGEAITDLTTGLRKALIRQAVSLVEESSRVAP